MTKKYIYKIDTSQQDAPAFLLRAVGHNKNVLEIGCASGMQSRILKDEQSCKVTGIEIDSTAAKDASKYCDSIIIGDIESLDLNMALGERRFDVITIADVLEHLRNPAKVLARLKSYLTDDGYIVASIPNVVHGGLILHMAKGRFDYNSYGLLDDTHIKFFTLKTIHHLFEDSGLKISKIDRAMRTVEQTEFYKGPLSPAEISFLNFIRENNSEFETYQFILTAHVSTEKGAGKTYIELNQEEEIKDLKLINTALQKNARSSDSKLQWVTSRPAYKIYAALTRILRFK